jgi:hypothetical protein
MCACVCVCVCVCVPNCKKCAHTNIRYAKVQKDTTNQPKREARGSYDREVTLTLDLESVSSSEKSFPPTELQEVTTQTTTID